MSRVAKAPVPLPDKVKAEVHRDRVEITGPLGNLQVAVHHSLRVEQGEQGLQVQMQNSGRTTRALAGTIRALLANAVHGVSEGFTKQLQLRGVGYRARVAGSGIDLTLGLSHPVHIEPLPGVKLEVASQTEVRVKGANRQQVGQMAAQIRKLRLPSVYRDKGIRYVDEQVRRKESSKK